MTFQNDCPSTDTSYETLNVILFAIKKHKKKKLFLVEQRTINHSFIENVNSLLAKTCADDGEDHAHEIVEFNKAIEKYDDTKNSDEDPTSHHFDRWFCSSKIFQ